MNNKIEKMQVPARLQLASVNRRTSRLNGPAQTKIEILRFFAKSAKKSAQILVFSSLFLQMLRILNIL